jgi:hypothetical protein
MRRVHIICEGQTEETFVNEVLGPHLHRFEVFPCAALVGKPGHKGGNVTTARMARDIRLRLLGDPQACCTTFFDFYGLDTSFVGKAEAMNKRTPEDKAREIETALRDHVQEQTDDTVIQRFEPYVQMYEFEGLLFSDPAKLASGVGKTGLAGNFTTIRNGFGSPEEINDSQVTAPSKRILALMPEYDKPLHGSLAALEVGLDVIRAACPRFNRWVAWMESLR